MQTGAFFIGSQSHLQATAAAATEPAATLGKRDGTIV